VTEKTAAKDLSSEVNCAGERSGLVIMPKQCRDWKQDLRWTGRDAQSWTGDEDLFTMKREREREETRGKRRQKRQKRCGKR
jgi:hypothetical protein